MRTLIIYHSRDLDGWTSGAIAYRYYNSLKQGTVELRGYDYGEPVSKAEELDFDRIVMLDVSYPAHLMGWLAVKPNCEFIWIDHHKSAIEEVGKHIDIKELYGLRNTNYAACELAWFYFYPDTQTPTIVNLLGLYDSFRHKGTKEEHRVLAFQYAARARWASVQDILEHSWFFEPSMLHAEGMIAVGKEIYNYLKTVAKQTYEKRAEVDFDGFKFAVVNSERLNPINFGINYHNDGYNGFACYWDTPTGRSWSLYNDDGRVDCSLICKARGGGGHKGAAGFVQDISFPPYTGIIPKGDWKNYMSIYPEPTKITGEVAKDDITEVEFEESQEQPTVLGDQIEYLFGVGALDIPPKDYGKLVESLLHERPILPEDAFIKPKGE